MEESNLYKPNWGETFIQEASHLVQMQMQAEMNKEEERLAAEKDEESGPQHDVAKEEGKNRSESEKKTIKITNLEVEKKEIILPKLDVEKKTVDLDDEARERLAQELIEEEEKEAAAASKKKNKGKGKGK